MIINSADDYYFTNFKIKIEDWIKKANNCYIEDNSKLKFEIITVIKTLAN